MNAEDQSTTAPANDANSSQIMNNLIAQLSALQKIVGDLQKDTNQSQMETQRLRESIERRNIELPETTSHRQSEDCNTSNSQDNASVIHLVSPNSFRKLYDLPAFSGDPEDWPLFISNYRETTANFAYSDTENTIRLRKCLQGAAKEAVSSLLIHPRNVREVIEELSFRFGRPEILIRIQLAQIQQWPSIVDSRIDAIVPFSTKVRNVVANLESSDSTQHLNNPMLLEDMLNKLPLSKRLEWTRHAYNIKPYATLKDFASWLNDLAKVVQLLPQTNVATTPKTSSQQPRRMFYTNEGMENTSTSNFRAGMLCVCCGSCDHSIGKCDSFKNSSIDARWQLVKNKHLCFSCLKQNHGAATCRNRKHCSTNGCRRVHHKLLHESVQPMPHASTVQTMPERIQNCRIPSNNNLLFRILPVVLSGPKGESTVFAMFDEGSSISILEDNVAKKLGLVGKTQQLTLQWYGDKVVTEPSRSVTLEIKGKQSGAQSYEMRNVKTVQKLSLPKQTFLKESVSHLRQVPIESYMDVQPALLIGLDNCHLGLAIDTVEGKSNEPVGAKTRLGWVAYGRLGTDTKSKSVVLHIKEVSTFDKLNQLVESYFTTENFGVEKTGVVLESDENLRAKKIMNESTRKVGNQFETGLLWRIDKPSFPNALPMATKRLFTIEAKMRRDPAFANKYKEQMLSYIRKGYAREMSSSELEIATPCKWYLPHFGVVHPSKPEKLRIVFDAAAKVHDVSLNALLMKGPEQAKPLLSVLFKFRQGAVAVAADIAEMFSQVRIREADQSAQRFLWRFGKQDEPIRTFVMTSMIFGAACSPCSAEYIKNLNAASFRDVYPEAVSAILDNHYVDDYVCSFDSEETAERVSMEVTNIHSQGGFTLRNFVCNSKALQIKLNGQAQHLRSTVDIQSDNNSEKVLGLYWNTNDDTFRFHLKFHKFAKETLDLDKPLTKRQILAIVMSVFDPFGFLANFLIYSKILLQNTWKAKIGWDEPLPQQLHLQWKLWWTELAEVNKFQVQRCYSANIPKAESIQLHIFTDASESAFAAVGYLRIAFQEEVDVAFVAAKTRCAPQKTLSIPRLELQAAVLGCRLQATIRANHQVNVASVVYWSDSQTVILWLQSSERKYKPFVAHRIAEILDKSEPSDWHWLPTNLNVADDATRAINPPRFSTDSRWLRGPEFLYQPEHLWPHCNKPLVTETLDEEIRQRLHLAKEVSIFHIDFSKYSSFLKLKRVVAWAHRFISILLKRIKKKTTEDTTAHIMPYSNEAKPSELTVAEIAFAEKVLCRQAQHDAFSAEMSLLRRGEYVARSSVIYQLTPCLDDDNILRVNGRLDAAQCLPIEARRPIILPQRHPLTQLIVHHYHHKMHHQNDSLTINEIRQRYWIVHIRAVLKNVKERCHKCKLSRAKPKQPLMGQLPPDRVTPFVRPFSYTGLDFFGPLQVTMGRRHEKRWVALFTCLTIRAVHLELAADLSTDACLLCLRNFINRRGVPVRIRSDNGTNFIGAQRKLQQEARLFDTDRLQSELSSKGIEWKFNCPLNPSEGGAWERMVQSVKKVLSVTLREVAPRVETLRSLLIEAENIVNSRPLTELPLTSEEDEPLTPNHFLIGCTNSTQTTNVDDSPICSRKQWQVLQQLKNRFWKRWILEYLPILTRRSKWHVLVSPLKIDDLVLICDGAQPRNKWQRGKVIKVYPGKDGQVRSAEVQTSGGVLRRPASKLAVLDIGGESL